MNPEMAYFIRPCSLPQKPALAPCKTQETHRELSPQAFDIARFLGDDQHRGGSENEFSPCAQGAAGNFRGDDWAARRLLTRMSEPRSSSKSSASFSRITPPNCSVSTMVTARR
jgi:hypothetical protein